MLSYLLSIIFFFFLAWLIPRLFWLFKTIYMLKKQIKKQTSAQPNFYEKNWQQKSDFSFQNKEKDISHRAKIVEDKKGAKETGE